MSAGKIRNHNYASMTNTLSSSQEMAAYDHCCGIHGAARERKGIKKGTSAMRRRYEKALIANEMKELAGECDGD